MNMFWTIHNALSINNTNNINKTVNNNAITNQLNADSNNNNNSNNTQQPTKPNNTDDFHNTNWSEIDIPRYLISLTVFSTVENLVFYPFSVLKTREQSDRTKLSAYNSFKYHLKQSLQHSKGINNLYRGFWFSSCVNLPTYGIYTAIYTSVKQQLGYDPTLGINQHTYLAQCAPLLAGALADAISVPLFVPGDVITQRLQLSDTPYKHGRDAFKQIVKEHGYGGLFVGLNATLITSTIASAVWWQVYETTKSSLYHKYNVTEYLPWPTDGVNRWPMIIAGFLAGEITSVVVNPLDVVKTRLQTQNNNHHTAYKGTLSGLRELWIEEGISGMFRGVYPKLLSRGPLSAITSLTYELILYFGRKDIT